MGCDNATFELFGRVLDTLNISLVLRLFSMNWRDDLNYIPCIYL